MSKNIMSNVVKMILSEDEAELVEAIRNLQRAFPNGYDELLYYCQQLFDALIEMPKD